MSNRKKIRTTALNEVIREYREDYGDPEVAKQASTELALLKQNAKDTPITSKKDITVDSKLLKSQIKGLLNSNIEEEIKEGLHNLLGAIYDGVVDEGSVTIVKHGRKQ
ncbi:MAG: hypothetical protein WC976_06175 [Caldisericia bacterium]